MDVIAVGPLRVGSLLWRKAEDRSVLTVVAKVTFALAPGESALSDAPEDVGEREDHWDDDPGRSCGRARAGGGSERSTEAGPSLLTWSGFPDRGVPPPPPPSPTRPPLELTVSSELAGDAMGESGSLAQGARRAGRAKAVLPRHLPFVT